MIEQMVNVSPRASEIRLTNFVSGVKKLFRFANFSSIGSRSWLSLKAVAAGTTANFMSACIAGMLL